MKLRSPTLGLAITVLCMSVLLGAVAPTRALAGNGTFPHTVPVGVHPGPMAMSVNTGRVFVVNAGANPGSGSVSTLDAGTGATLRTTPVGSAPGPIMVAENQHRVIVVNTGRYNFVTGNYDAAGSVSVLNSVSGALVRTVGVDRGPGPLAVDDRAGRAFVASGGDLSNSFASSVCLISLHTGKLLETIPVASRPLGVVVDPDAWRAFVLTSTISGTGSGTVDVIAVGSGKLLTTINLTQRASAIALDAQTHRVFIGLLDGTVDVLDAIDSSTITTVKTGPGDYPQFAVAENTGRVFVACSGDSHGGQGSVTVLDSTSGSALATVDQAPGPRPNAVVPDAPASRAVVVEGGVVGGLTVLDETSGAVLHAFTYNPAAITVDARTGLVYFLGTNSRTLKVLDPLSYRLRWIVHLGFAASGLLVDPATRRIFIANGNAGTVIVRRAL